jgi:hypothetical protein
LKRQLAREVIVVRDFPGGICGAWRHGIMVQICQPLSEEPRVKVQKGERWLVTRGNKRWVYGVKHIDDHLMQQNGGELHRIEETANEKLDSKTLNTSAIRPPRGWFPRMCARPKSE